MFLCEQIMSSIGRIHFSTKCYVWFSYQLHTDGETFYAVMCRKTKSCHAVEHGTVIKNPNLLSPHGFVSWRHSPVGSRKTLRWSVKPMIIVLGLSLKEWEDMGKAFLSLSWQLCSPRV